MVNEVIKPGKYKVHYQTTSSSKGTTHGVVHGMVGEIDARRNYEKYSSMSADDRIKEASEFKHDSPCPVDKPSMYYDTFTGKMKDWSDVRSDVIDPND